MKRWLGILMLLTLPAWADGEGTATISPGPFAQAAARGTWTITYQPGPAGIQPGGGVRLQLSGFPVQLFSPPQCTDPKGADYTTASCSDPAVPVKCSFSSVLRGGWMQVEELAVIVGAPGLKPDQTLSIVYGDTSGGGPGGATRGAEGDDLPIRVYSDLDGDGKSAPLAAFPRLSLTGSAPAKVVVFAQSQAVVGQPTRVAVSLRDPRNAVATEAPSDLTLSSPALAKPIQVSFRAGQRAVENLSVTFTKPGATRLQAKPATSAAESIRLPAAKFVQQGRREVKAEEAFRPELTAVALTALRARPGSTLRLVSHWQNIGTAPAKAEYRIYCHLERRPAQGKALANWDHVGKLPTTQWQPGQAVTVERVVDIPAGVEPGEHALTYGLFRVADNGFVNLLDAEVCRLKIGPDEPLWSALQPAFSNPIEVLDQAPERRLLWGDLHCHTENSGDGSGSADGLYRYARDTSLLDFCACSDHVGPNYPAAQWQHNQEAARRWNEPGRFIAILGYEWSNQYHGDLNVYHARDDQPIRVPTTGQCEDLFPALDGVDCIVIPHHPAYPVGLRGAAYSRYDPRWVPVVEMCSGHGLGEYLGNPRPYGRNRPMGPSLPGGFAQDGLRRGLRLGFIASSDDHTAHAGKIGFLAAVQATDVTREGILNALRERSCYASTGARILLDFTADGQPMGRVVECAQPPLLTATVEGTAPLKSVEIVRDGEVCAEGQPDGLRCDLEVRAKALDRPESWFYLRVIQDDGEMAWSSPIFVQNTGPRPTLVVSPPQVAGPQAGQPTPVTVLVRNTGTAASAPGKVSIVLDHAPAVPVAREKQPARGGIGGLLANAGFQAWRWPVDETSVNVFLRWGGGQDARNCAGSLTLLEAVDYYFTPFHDERNDTYHDDGHGTITWQTTAEAGTGDGLNLWVRINPRKPTRLLLDATRGGQHRPAEVSLCTGPVTKLPVELMLVDYDPARWVGQVKLPALAPGKSAEVKLDWTPPAGRTGKLVATATGGEHVRTTSDGTEVKVP